jgi:hypothetical protein
VLHRAGKEGLGKAYLAGFQWALARDFTHVFEMDADFSHDPATLPRFLEAARTADLVLGSRWVEGGGTVGWPVQRRLLSKCGSLYARTVLGVDIRDLTGGFKCFNRRVLQAIDLDTVQTRGYGFQIELTFRALRQGFKVVEIPIRFRRSRRRPVQDVVPHHVRGLHDGLEAATRRVTRRLAALWALAAGVALGLPLLADEAYYLDWSRHPALGYFDHPPGIALWVAAGFGHPRLVGVLLFPLTAWLLGRAAVAWGVDEATGSPSSCSARPSGSRVSAWPHPTRHSCWSWLPCCWPWAVAASATSVCCSASPSGSSRRRS